VVYFSALCQNDAIVLFLPAPFRVAVYARGEAAFRCSFLFVSAVLAPCRSNSAVFNGCSFFYIKTLDGAKRLKHKYSRKTALS
jgi:hypothetical protein